MKIKTKYEHLEERIESKFAWLPIRIRIWDKIEIRWLEQIKVKQSYRMFGNDLRIGLFGGYWKNEEFLDN